MCFFIAEGYHYTRDVNKYTFRLFSPSPLSRTSIFFSNDFVDWHSFIPFYYGQALNQTSVMWPLAWGLVMLPRREQSAPAAHGRPAHYHPHLPCHLPERLELYRLALRPRLRHEPRRSEKQSFWLVFYVALYAVVYFFAIDKVYGILQMGVVLAIPVIKMYNGQRGKNPRVNRFMKWLVLYLLPAAPAHHRTGKITNLRAA